MATRNGRLADNDVVLDDAEVSHHHAVVSDTGTSFVITDLRSAKAFTYKAVESGEASRSPTATGF